MALTPRRPAVPSLLAARVAVVSALAAGAALTAAVHAGAQPVPPVDPAAPPVPPAAAAPAQPFTVLPLAEGEVPPPAPPPSARPTFRRSPAVTSTTPGNSASSKNCGTCAIPASSSSRCIPGPCPRPSTCRRCPTARPRHHLQAHRKRPLRRRRRSGHRPAWCPYRLRSAFRVGAFRVGWLSSPSVHLGSPGGVPARFPRHHRRHGVARRLQPVETRSRCRGRLGDRHAHVRPDPHPQATDARGQRRPDRRR